MKIKRVLSVVVLLLCCAGCAALTGGTDQDAAVTQDAFDMSTSVVRIRGYEGVSPLNLFIEPGTVVVWLNQYKGRIEITFPDRKVTVACKSPVNFVLSEEGHFVSNAIEFGAVASLCFVERGTFDYFIKRSPMSDYKRREGFRFEGKIIVQ